MAQLSKTSTNVIEERLSKFLLTADFASRSNRPSFILEDKFDIICLVVIFCDLALAFFMCSMLTNLLTYSYWIENFYMQQKYVNRSVNMEHMKNAIIGIFFLNYKT